VTARSILLSPWVPLVLAVAVFIPIVVNGDFIHDDLPQIKHNPTVKASDWQAAITKGYWENAAAEGYGFDLRGDLYRPVTTLSVMLSYSLYGTNAWPYHLENVLLHAVVSALIVMLLRRWSFDPRVASLAGSLFAIAPIHVEPVCGIILRNELLAALFGCLYLIALSKGRTVFSGLWLLLAVATKESALALPLVAILADRVFLTVRDRSWKTYGVRYLPTLLAVVVLLVLRLEAIGQIGLAEGGGVSYFESESWPVVWLTMASFAWHEYLLPAVMGGPLIWDYSRITFPHATLADVQAWYLAVQWVVVGALALLWAWRRRCPWASSFLIFAVLLVPTSNVVARTGVIGAARLLYLPYLGIAMLMAMGMVHLWDRFRVRGPVLRSVMIVFALSLGVYYGVQDLRGQAKWASAEAFYSDIIEKSPATRRGRSTNAKAWASLTATRFPEVLRGYLGLRAEAREGRIDDAEYQERYRKLGMRAGFESAFENSDWALSLEPHRTWVMVAEPFMLSGHHLGRHGRLLERIDLVIDAKREAKALEGEIEQIERVRAMLGHVDAALDARRQLAELIPGVPSGPERDGQEREIVRTGLLECQLALRYFQFRQWPALNLEGFEDPGPMPLDLQMHPVVQRRLTTIGEDVLQVRAGLQQHWRP